MIMNYINWSVINYRLTCMIGDQFYLFWSRNRPALVVRNFEIRCVHIIQFNDIFLLGCFDRWALCRASGARLWGRWYPLRIYGDIVSIAWVLLPSRPLFLSTAVHIRRKFSLHLPCLKIHYLYSGYLYSIQIMLVPLKLHN